MQRFCPIVGRFCVQKGFPHLFALQAKGKDFLSAKTNDATCAATWQKRPFGKKAGATPALYNVYRLKKG